ncbi:MAG: RNA polymerase sigma factor SigF [Oscillatoriales cyanobacterium RM2_1_1]|nr:RNA polymerase sigma factor SigF [Oscillatoriales cyanobacterium SM2_3_0]NJO44930.1 RNA polymerase sigma factor SigF [Oscillatoriales cyanobacterium RM2_1_1]
MPVVATQELKSDSLELLRQYQYSPSQVLRNQIVQLNLGLARKEVHRWVNRCGESYDDLLQVGCIGLIRAIERFDVSKGNAFSSFATPYIRGEIQHYLRDKSPSVRLPRTWTALERQAEKAIHELRITLGRSPKDLEVAQALHIQVEEWSQVKLMSRNRSLLSLDAPVKEGDEGTVCLGDMMLDQSYFGFQSAQEDQLCLKQALARLEEGTRKVLEFVFFEELTHKEAAKRLGVSTVTVSRRIKKGIDCLRETLVETEWSLNCDRN